MQCKDIPELPILEFLEQNTGRWCWWFETPDYPCIDPLTGETIDWMPTVRDAMPAGLPDKLILAKMSGLIRRGLVEGCDCGCRGDFELSDKGREYLMERRLARIAAARATCRACGAGHGAEVPTSE